MDVISHYTNGKLFISKNYRLDLVQSPSQDKLVLNPQFCHAASLLCIRQSHKNMHKSYQGVLQECVKVM